MNRIASIIKNPERLLQRAFPGSLFSDRKTIELLYRKRFGRSPDLVHPRTFNEKLLWLTLYDRQPKYTEMVDKCRAKDYIDGILGPGHTPGTLGVYHSTKEIDFETLPERYVLKCNHDSGSVVLCDGRRPLPWELDKLERALRRNYFWFSREWAYKDVRAVIFAEKYIEAKDPEKGIVDYKFYCFHGEPKYVLVISHRASGGRETFFNTSWETVEVTKGYRRHDTAPEKPARFGEMIDISRRLSKGVPFLRVDMFEDAEGNVLVGELTLTPSSGLVPFEPEAYDRIFGDELLLPSDSTV